MYEEIYVGMYRTKPFFMYLGCLSIYFEECLVGDLVSFGVGIYVDQH